MSNPNRLKNRGFSPRDQRLQNLRCETLYIGDHEYLNISSFAVLGIKLWPDDDDDDDLNRSDPLYLFKFIQSKVQYLYKMLSPFSYNFIFNIANLKIFAYL